MARSRGEESESRASRTQAEEVDGAIVQEVAYVAGVSGHGAEGVCAAGRQGEQAAGAHVHQQRPGVAVIQDVRRLQGAHKPPREEPGTQGCTLNLWGEGSSSCFHLTVACLPFPWDDQPLHGLTLLTCQEQGRVSRVLTVWIYTGRAMVQSAYSACGDRSLLQLLAQVTLHFWLTCFQGWGAHHLSRQF